MNGTKYEFDLITVNNENEEVVVFEVKTTLKIRHVDHFIKKLKSFREIFHYNRDKTIYGAIAYLKANEGAVRNSEKKVFLSLEPQEAVQVSQMTKTFPLRFFKQLSNSR